jgi:hypothetical protein
LILCWVIGKKKDLHGTVEVNNYRDGVAARVYRDARKEKKKEEEGGKGNRDEAAERCGRSREAERKAELARLKGPGEPESAVAGTQSEGRAKVKAEEVDETPKVDDKDKYKVKIEDVDDDIDDQKPKADEGGDKYKVKIEDVDENPGPTETNNSLSSPISTIPIRR